MKAKIATAAILLAFSPLYAQEDAPDPIDVTLDAEMEKNPSTAGMVGAASAALEAWEKDIQFSLDELKKTMSPEEIDVLVVSQKAWEVFASTELDTQSEIFGKMEGTMWIPVSAVNSMKLYKERALRLRGYLQILSER